MMDITYFAERFIVSLFSVLPSLALKIVWAIILFQCGTLLQKNRDVARYFNIRLQEDMDHLVDKTGVSNSLFSPPRLISSIGTMLKVYAVLTVLVFLLNIVFRWG